MSTNKWNKTLGLEEYWKLEYRNEKEKEKKIKKEDIEKYLMSMGMYY